MLASHTLLAYPLALRLGIAKNPAVTVAVRPEDIVVQGVQSGAANTFEARIDEMEFLGSFYRADLVSERLGPARLRADLSINLIRSQDIDEGDALAVLLPKERIRVYPGSTVND